MDFFIWLAILIVLILVGFWLDREIYFYEGVRLGPRVQAWLYDGWAKKYDQGKHESQLHDTEMLALPLLGLLKDMPTPFILDFATGTGRLSDALVNQPEFDGHIVALDLSQGMLEKAAVKLSTAAGRVEFLRHQQLPLPFPDSSFDAVCALEVLELFPSMDEPLAELTRVLRPGGVLLTSRGTEESGRKAKVKSKEIFASLLEKHGVEKIEIVKWWKLFDRVLARKVGDARTVEARTLSAVLRCGQCNQIHWKKEAQAWTCEGCGKVISISKEGILLN